MGSTMGTSDQAMLRTVLLAAAVASASAFAPMGGLVRPKARTAAVSSLKMQGDFSDAVPFLKRPINLDGEYAGDVGFDPFGFSDVFDLRVLREAELKHGRFAMLAVLLFPCPGEVHLPLLPQDGSRRCPRLLCPAGWWLPDHLLDLLR